MFPSENFSAKMDIKQQFEKMLEGMEWGEVVSTLIDVIGEVSRPPQPPLPLPSLDPNQHLQLVYPVGPNGCSEEVRECSLVRSFTAKVHFKVPRDPSPTPSGRVSSLVCHILSWECVCLHKVQVDSEREWTLVNGSFSNHMPSILYPVHPCAILRSPSSPGAVPVSGWISVSLNDAMTTQPVSFRSKFYSLKHLCILSV